MQATTEEIFELDADDTYLKCCGEVFITMKGLIIIHCNMCEMRYNSLKLYSNHLSGIHLLETTDEYLKHDTEEEAGGFEKHVIEFVESCSYGSSPAQNEFTEIIEIEPTTYLNDSEDIKNELIDDNASTIEVLDEDAAWLKKLLATNKKEATKAEHTNNMQKNIKNFKNSKKATHTKEKTRVELGTSTNATLSTSTQSIVESTFVPNVFESQENNYKIANSTKLDAETFHELPTCDRPTLKASRKPATSLSDEKRKHKCPYCSFAAKDKTNLWSHIQRHSNNKPHQCTYCPKNFYTRVELTFHTRYHTGERPFLCTECGHTFITKEKLKQHMKRHNNQRDHHCPDCSKRFFSSQEVREHRKVHTKETPFKCDKCNGVFSRKKALKAHQKLHENKRSYKCKVCDAGFNQSAGLYLHMKTKHQVSKQIEKVEINMTLSHCF